MIPPSDIERTEEHRLLDREVFLAQDLLPEKKNQGTNLLARHAQLYPPLPVLCETLHPSLLDPPTPLV
jgi:hypothetical protein